MNNNSSEKNTVEEDISTIIGDCDSIITTLNQRSEDTREWAPDNTSWPFVELTPEDIKNFSSILEKNGTIVAKLIRFSDSLGNQFVTISQDILLYHSQAFDFSQALDQGQVYRPSEQGKIWNIINLLKAKLQEFERQYTTYKSYNKDADSKYAQTTTESKRKGIHWGKLNTVLAIIGILTPIILIILFA